MYHDPDYPPIKKQSKFTMLKKYRKFILTDIFGIILNIAMFIFNIKNGFYVWATISFIGCFVVLVLLVSLIVRILRTEEYYID